MRPPPLEPLEISSGMVFGRRRTPPPPAVPRTGPSGVREVLAELLLPALSRPPCLVAFSGGRDSSSLLALATHVARGHGLDDPVPVTLRFEQHPRTAEADWQEMTVHHLGLDRWEIVSLDTELDGVGPIAGEVLRRHGPYWPANAHTLVPLLQAARGGVLVTGNGGDEVFSPWMWRRVPLRQLARVRPRRRAMSYMMLVLLPMPVRIRLWFRRSLRLPWLRPAARRRVRRLHLARLSHRSPNWGEAVQRLLDTRYLELTSGIFGVLAREAGAHLCQPFFDPRFIKAAADAGPRDGYASRSAAVDALFGDLLPEALVQRGTKASFTEVFFGPFARAFAKGWDGTGLDPALVDPEALRLEWSKPRPDFRSLSPLQAAWLASEAEPH